MGQTLQTILQAAGVLILILGIAVVYAAPKIVDKRKLDERQAPDPERIAGLNEEGIRKFKRDAAILDMKIKGVLIALPGAILILVLYKL